MNEKGFVTTALIFFLPFLFVLLFGSFWTIWFINQKHHLDNICYEGVLESQQKLVDGNQKLLSLNSLAWSYILEKRFLEVLIITAPPQVKLVAKKRRRVLVLQQKALARNQKAILKWSSYLAKASLLKVRRKFYEKVRELRGYWQVKNPRAASIAIFPVESQVRVRVQDIAPVYERGANHERTQFIQARWQIPLRSMLPNWLKKQVPVHQWWKGQCESHPHKGEYRWHPAIGEDKLSRKP